MLIRFYFTSSLIVNVFFYLWALDESDSFFWHFLSVSHYLFGIFRCVSCSETNSLTNDDSISYHFLDKNKINSFIWQMQLNCLPLCLKTD